MASQAKGKGFLERNLQFLQARERKSKKLNPEEARVKQEQDEARQRRLDEMQQVKLERELKLRQDDQVKLGRDQMMENVAAIISKHILAAELYITAPTEGASLFNESNFKRQEWNIQTTSGYSSTMPLFIYTYQKVVQPVSPCKEEDILKFIRKVVD